MIKKCSSINKQTSFKKPFGILCLLFLGWLIFKSNEKSTQRFLELDEEEPDIRLKSVLYDTQEEPLTQEDDVPNEISHKKDIFHFIINKSTNKYHIKECNAVKKLSGEKRLDTDIEADSVTDAKKQLEKMGYAPCGLCDR